MRVLVVSWLPLDPIDSGYKSRVVGLYSRVTKFCEVLVLSPPPGLGGLPWKPVGGLKTNRSIPVKAFARSTFLPDFTRGVLREALDWQPDFAIAEGVWAGSSVRKAAGALGIPWGVTVTSVDPLSSDRSYSSPIPRLIWTYERWVYRRADRLFTRNVEEAVRLQRSLRPHPPRISVVPDGAHVARMVTEEEIGQLRAKWHIRQEERIGLFVGRLDHLPNRRGLEWFSRKVMPQMGELPFRVRWLAVGAYQPQTPIPPFEFVGYVEDLDVALAAADVCIAPCRHGSGASSKVLDYLGAGCPVVATPHAVSGLSLEPDRDALITDDPEEFARFIRMILLDDALAEDLGSHGRSLITQELNWEKVSEKMFREISRSWGIPGSPPETSFSAPHP